VTPNISNSRLFIAASVFAFPTARPHRPSRRVQRAAGPALAKLTEGNRRFADSQGEHWKPTAAGAPKPHKRSTLRNHRWLRRFRTSPEIVFDQISATCLWSAHAGNLVDDYALGTIEYGVEHLGARACGCPGHRAAARSKLHGKRICSWPYQRPGARTFNSRQSR